MSYLQKNKRYYGLCVFLFLSFNLYFIFLLPDINIKYLFYLDFLIIVVIISFVCLDYTKFKYREMEKKKFLQYKEVIYEELPIFENREIAEHDIKILQAKIQKQFEENCDLQDYVAKFSHEIKIPLAASLLINEKITDADIRTAMKENLERINQQLNTMLLGCKLQSSLFDLQIKKVSLQECVKASIRNNQFFLIQNHFSMNISIGEVSVYTDMSWLIYILDQLLNNAIKYRKENPYIKIWTEEKESHHAENKKELFIEDHGVGIKESDLRRIFEKGFIGSNYHNGKYKSTGMGLYLVEKVVKRLEHEIYVESEYGNYTRFCIIFRDHREYFHLL